ncbi:uncharacterized protein LOC130725290 [Lotus japonicus]|uniref:uncharacterized protein LOC130725290 n=1 Tax=Lotus japonicus TaxID=34305 RepID=UPI0025841E77|nr:uncharacterized protein LOC130725290 [Lotus japonicus]
MGDPWLVIGDFNAYLTAFDKSGGANLNLSSMQRFQECLLSCGLSDMGFKGPPFTWEGRGVKERLDRGVKMRLMKRLEGINRRLNMTFDRGLDNLQRQLWKEYNIVLIQEELLWAQKSRCMWLKYGDRNTNFFHTVTIICHKRNKIEALLDDNGYLITDYDELLAHTVSFFERSYVDDGTSNPLPCVSTFPTLGQEKIQRIHVPFVEEEIKDAIFEMGSLKALGPDGLQPVFFQSQWPIVGKSVVNFVTDCYPNPNLIEQVNETLLVLIPKVDAPGRIT